MMPPAVNLLLLALACYWWRRRPRLAIVLASVAVMTLYLLSTSLVSTALLQGLEQRYPALLVQRTFAQQMDIPDAIVVLGGGRTPNALEYGGADDVSLSTLQRLQYGAYLHRLSGAPLLVSGGILYDKTETESEAALMARVLARDFQVQARWLEELSRNTRENARYSAELLQAQGIKRIWLVTQAWHMPRSVDAFTHYGFSVVAAPTGFSRLPADGSLVAGLIPRARHLTESELALQEWLGITYYRLQAVLGISAL